MSACSQLNATNETKGAASNPFLMTQGITFNLKNKVFKSVEDGGGPFNLTGYTGRSQMRRDPLGTGTPVAEFTVTILAPATGGVAQITLDASLSVNIEPGVYVFDIEYSEDADPDDSIISGTSGQFLYIQVLPGVTKP